MTMLDPNAAKVLAAMAGQPTLDMMTPPQAREMFSTAFPTMQAAKPAVAEVRDLAALQGSVAITQRRLRTQTRRCLGECSPKAIVSDSAYRDQHFNDIQ